ncbi:MAG: DinB family protein [Saprospiraceae bacterium]|nr:DinB family protein [Saprospiraceae bacterium]
MDFSLPKSLEILERTPAVLSKLLSGLSDEWTLANEGGETWSAFDVMGHLIHGEQTDWIPRIKHILEKGTSEPFAPFDRFAQFEGSNGKQLEQLLEAFTRLRYENLQILKQMRLEDDALNLQGIHPALGLVTIKELLSCWTVHDLGHIAQISRIMAKQYSLEVGPWVAYLGVLK